MTLLTLYLGISLISSGLFLAAMINHSMRISRMSTTPNNASSPNKGGFMDEFLKKRILKHLDLKQPMAGGSIAWEMKWPSTEVRQALQDLIEEGRVRLTADGYKYELAHGGYVPPEAA